MKNLLYSASFAMLVLFSSCQKEISGDFLAQAAPTNLTGTWNFLNTHVSISSTVEVNDGTSDVKSTTVSDYITSNNKGSLLFSDSLMISSAVSYDVNTTAIAFTYQDGNLVDSTDFPFTFSLPSTNSSGAYKRIGTDSISVSSGSLNQVAGATGMVSPPGGYKYKIISDTLVLTALLNQTSTDNSFGFPIQTRIQGAVVSTLKKQ